MSIFWQWIDVDISPKTNDINYVKNLRYDVWDGGKKIDISGEESKSLPMFEYY
jgi:hypothetical protein